MDQVSNTVSLGQTLKSLIDGHLMAHPNVSLRGLASREEGMSREYLRRLAAGEIPDHKIDKDKALLVLMTISKKRSMKDLMAHFGEPVSSWLVNMFPVMANSNSQLIEEELDAILGKGDDECVAYYMARSSAGISPATAKDILGNSGVEALKLLESKGFVEQKDGRYFGVEKGVFSSSMATMRKVVATIMRFYRPAHFGRNRNYMLLITGSLNQTGISAERELYRKFHEDLGKLYQDPDKQGDIQCFAIACMDSFNVLEEAPYETH